MICPCIGFVLPMTILYHNVMYMSRIWGLCVGDGCRVGLGRVRRGKVGSVMEFMLLSDEKKGKRNRRCNNMKVNVYAG